MGSASGLALKSVQWFIRGVQFCCAALILALTSYFLATLHNHNLGIATWIRAVEGISGVAVLYTGLGLLLLCCVAGHPFSSAVAILLDISFIGAFIYVAWANRGGAGSCRGNVDTAFGSGNAATNVVDNGNGGFTQLPSLRQACQMQTACFSVAIVAIFFFIFSALVEVVLVRHRRKERRFGPSPQNNYTSGYGKKQRGGGLFGFRRRRGTGMTDDPNVLPQHTDPSQVRDSYATEQTRVGTAHTHDGAAGAAMYNKYGESGHGHQVGGNAATTTHPEYAEYPQQQAPVGAAHEGGNVYSTAHGDTGYGRQTGVAAPETHAEYPHANYQYEDGRYNQDYSRTTHV